MNFANLLLAQANNYRLVCESSPENVRQSIASTALQTLVEAPQTLTDDCAHTMRVKMLKTTRRPQKNNDQTKFRFEAGRSTNIFRRLFQPRTFGSISGSDAGSTVQLKVQVPFLATNLINVAANISLFSMFGILGSYFLLPDATPLAAVLMKAAVWPAIFALVVAVGCQYLLRADGRAVADALAQKTRASRLETVAPIAAEVYAKTFLSLNSALTLICCAAILAAACMVHNWAWQQWTSGHYEKSEQLCLQVLDLARLSLGKDNGGVAGCEYYIAECSRCEGKLEQAEKFYLQALADLKRNVDPSITFGGDTLLNLGRVYEEQNKLEDALSCYFRAKKIFEDSPKFGPRCIWIAHILNRIAAVQLKQKNFVGAEKSARQALVIDTTYKQEAGQSIAQDNNDLGVIFYQAGNFEQARRSFVEALRLKTALPESSSYSQGTTLYNLSFAQEKLGKKAEYKISRKQAIALWQKYLGLGSNSKLSPHDLYKKVLRAARPEYEVPNYDRRADLTVDGLGRI